MRDLVFPEPERTRNILSAIINFIKFAEERTPFLKKLRDQSSSALEERDRTKQKVEELRQKIAEIKCVASFGCLCRVLKELQQEATGVGRATTFGAKTGERGAEEEHG